MTPHFPIRTDLAVEAREGSLSESGAGQLTGVLFEQQEEEGGRVQVSRVWVQNEKGARILGKPQGNYLTVEAQDLWKDDGGIHREVSRVLARQIRILLGEAGLNRLSRVLVAGLGNQEVTSDSLGPRVLGNLQVTRNLYPYSIQDTPSFPHRERQRSGQSGKTGKPSQAAANGRNTTGGEAAVGTATVSGIVPGVMAQTGMEAAEVVRGVIQETEPDALIVVDALAARSVRRLGTTIQLTDTGIHPGSGVGNRRSRLDAESMGIPVIAVGAPTVVGATAIVYDAVENLLEDVEEEKRYQMVRDLVEPKLGPMIVTPKDVDDRVRRLSYVISEGLNIALLGDAYTGA